MLKISSIMKKKFGALQIDEVKFTVGYEGRQTRELTSVEFRILACFARYPNRALRKSEVLENIWGDTLVHAKTVNVHFSHLRRKLREIGVDVVHEGKSCFRVVPFTVTKDELEELRGAS